MHLKDDAADILMSLAHVPSIEQLAPGLLEVIESSGTKKWFGEFAAITSKRLDRQAHSSSFQYLEASLRCTQIISSPLMLLRHTSLINSRQR